MATVKVIHKQRAYIGGRTYDAGEEAEIDEKDFAESVHEKVDVPAAKSPGRKSTADFT